MPLDDMERPRSVSHGPGPRSDHGRNEAALTKEMIIERNGT